MSSTFTPSRDVDMTKEKDWPLNLGMLDWDSTNIVFTKRSLVEFLKYAGVTVDPGFTNIQKLPRYAKFGKMATNEAEPAGIAETTLPAVTETSPNRRLLAEEFTDDALSMAPPRPSEGNVSDDAIKPVSTVEGSTGTGDFRPTRRVRTTPGGSSSIASIFGHDDTQQEFVPTRKVRERPGGKDNIEGLF
ncbi:hypothetical protein F5J12DRAFT_804485 [Pisolithus orientalis]|uniref:uncharacterized protein n=1 Tax=Pisolithus orientalis TaxID=936130 RepID=UPI0022242D67|nr:uncharacterized protein F5J12DRAFT_804485 [Pisolithus orientalis]KAI6028311.1 hypothetical protein F5J12DRAFT_804485 [Pisolithus orientalis]